MATRLQRARQVGAGVLALAALERLDLTAHVTEVLDPRTLLPQVGQGALAVECRRGDDAVLELLAAVDDPVSHAAVLAERAFLAALGGGCTLPLGALAVPQDGGARLAIDGMLASRDGRILLRRQVIGPASEPEVARHRAQPGRCSTTAAADGSTTGPIRRPDPAGSARAEATGGAVEARPR